MEAITVTTVVPTVDWLTATYKPLDSVVRAQARAYELLDARARAGYHMRPWEFYGYRGDTAGGITFGLSDRGGIVRLSGDQAAQHWQEFGDYASNVSRIDLAVTFWCSTDTPDLAKWLYARGQDETERTGPRPTLSLFTTYHGGDTLYLGRRSSDLYGRVYDKGRETKDAYYARAWRYELEVKGKTALPVTRQLLRALSPQQTIASTVKAHFLARSIPCPWDVEVSPIDTTRPQDHSDKARRLAWYRNAIAPSLEWCREEGFWEEALQALGILEDARK